MSCSHTVKLATDVESAIDKLCFFLFFPTTSGVPAFTMTVTVILLSCPEADLEQFFLTAKCCKFRKV